MTSLKQSYLVAYDIAEDYRRNRVAKILQTCGERLQYSVFLLEVRPTKMLRVRQQLESEMDQRLDSIIVCPLGASSQASQEMLFLGRRTYEDIATPTVI
ncbi:CRISPR-associated endonuclease Cas2 [Bifidobacterium eulemuris]|uniref:CRISPR-associated endoribonuclease Cas2 n=1 Tax=Bifidobacterium eulemuris TaxID=1765219 RepID=A0A7L9SRA1_9BIFI|nr:CRISPR-associated endonuclease Cas2 [Bifidobacterium eulemuris]